MAQPMYISDLEDWLADLRERYGDAVVHVALREYGAEELTWNNIDKLIRFEEWQRRGEPSRRVLVVGDH